MSQAAEDLTKRVFERVTQIDEQELQDFHVTLLPDFFLDHIVTAGGFSDTMERLRKLYLQGGGNLLMNKQLILSGGNAANTAKALAKLGVSAHFIGKTSMVGFELLKFFLEKNGVDISRVKTGGKLATTVALEFEGRNVMLSDAGSVEDFSFDCLDEKDLEVIASSDIVCVTNWTLNKEGTELAEKVFSFAKKRGVVTFFDSGDPSSREKDVVVLFKKVVSNRNLDIFSLNENELRHFTNLSAYDKDAVVSAAQSLQDKITARVDLHTSRFSYSNGATVDSFDVPTVGVSTGAGDTWNAGNIFGELLHFGDDERLLFANAVAAYYVSHIPPVHPSLKNIVAFLLQ
ncbi:MAG TPA: carbohydrate kinase family protein [Thermoplasmata archaeon]|nr:carbohydrate kinase family protein [Thermoplasmata archaeon]